MIRGVAWDRRTRMVEIRAIACDQTQAPNRDLKAHASSVRVRDRETIVDAYLALTAGGMPQEPLRIEAAPLHHDHALALALAIAACAQPDAAARVAAMGTVGVLGGFSAGRINGGHGVLSAARAARDAGCTELWVPAHVACDAAYAQGIVIRSFCSVSELLETLNGHPLTVVSPQALASAAEVRPVRPPDELVIGSARDLLSRRATVVRSIPPPSARESLEIIERCTNAGHSPARTLEGDLVQIVRPVRMPHYTAASIALQGEAALAHGGFLILEDLTEFRAPALRDLVAQRAHHDFAIIAGARPCPCGHAGSTAKQCSCGPVALESYTRRLREHAAILGL